MSDAAAARPSWPARVFVGVLAVVVATNLWNIVRNQRHYDRNDSPHLKPRDIASVAGRNSWDQVSATFRWYYQLRRLGAGGTLVVPPEMEGHRFYIEEVSRLHLEVDPHAAAVEQPFIDHVRPDETGKLDAERPVRIAIDPGATRYVVVRTADFKLYLVLSEARFQETSAWYRAEYARHPEWAHEVARRILPDSLPYPWYGMMRQLGAGATVVIAPEMEGHRRYLETISGLRVETAPASPELDAAIVAHLGDAPRTWLDLDRSCVVVAEPGATRYVVARTADFKTYVVMSEARSQAEAAWLAARPAPTASPRP